MACTGRSSGRSCLRRQKTISRRLSSSVSLRGNTPVHELPSDSFSGVVRIMKRLCELRDGDGARGVTLRHTQDDILLELTQLLWAQEERRQAEQLRTKRKQT